MRERSFRRSVRSVIAAAALAASWIVSPPCSAQPLAVGGIEPLSTENAASSAKPKDRKNRSRLPTFALVRGQAIVGTLAESHVSVLTKYGKLRVPFEEIVRIRFHPRLSEEDTVRFESLLAVLRKEPGDTSTQRALRDLGPGAFLLITAALAQKENEPLKSTLETIRDEIQTLDEIYLDPRDEIVTQRFTFKGYVEEESLQVTRGSLKLRIPVCDIRHIAYGELEIRKLFKVGPSHTEGSSSFLDSKHEVKKGQKFTLSPSGNMTWQGQSFGPAGISNHTWNSRQMGCLQWRIGSSGAWKVLASEQEVKADSKGALQFCVHLTGGASSGEFKVEFKMKTK